MLIEKTCKCRTYVDVDGSSKCRPDMVDICEPPYPRSLCSWPHTSLHLLEEGHNHPIVHFAYLCHMIGEEIVLFPFLYIKLFELGVEVALNEIILDLPLGFPINNIISLSLSITDPRLPTTKLICSNFHSEAAALSAPMMRLCYSFASASFTSGNPSSPSVDRLNSKIYTSPIDCGPIRSPAAETIHEERPWIEVVPCLLTFFDRYCHFYILCLLRQIFLAEDS